MTLEPPSLIARGGVPPIPPYASLVALLLTFLVNQSEISAQRAPWHDLRSPNQGGDGLFGYSVSGVPDADGDGRGDVFVGAHSARPQGGPNDAGEAYLFSGNNGSLLHTFISPNQQTSGEFGYAVSGVPDTDGDGMGDLLVGSFGENRAHLFSGKSGELLHSLISPIGLGDVNFGYSVAGVPDLDGDSRGDLIVGSLASENRGAAYVYSGSSGMILYPLASPNSMVSGLFGYSVSGIEDVDGDGRGDICTHSIRLSRCLSVSLENLFQMFRI